MLLEYAIPVWYSGITKQQSKLLEKIQRWATAIILNNWTMSYRVRCTLLALEPLYMRRKNIALTFGLRTMKNEKHQHFFQMKQSHYDTRNTVNTLEEYRARTMRIKRSPLVALTHDMNIHLTAKNNTRSI